MKEINEFNILYNLKLGEIISKILKKEQDILRQKSNETPEDNTAQKKYEEAKNNYEEFHNNYEEILKEERYDLSEEEQQKLKQFFRKAAKMCHPDIVSDELKSQAQEIIQKLNEAYAKKDLETVEEILNSLENGFSFDMASDIISDKKILKVKIADIRTKIELLNKEIKDIKLDETFIAIQEIEDMDEYFEFMKNSLNKKYEQLNTQSKKGKSLFD